MLYFLAYFLSVWLSIDRNELNPGDVTTVRVVLYSTSPETHTLELRAPSGFVVSKPVQVATVDYGKPVMVNWKLLVLPDATPSLIPYTLTLYLDGKPKDHILARVCCAQWPTPTPTPKPIHHVWLPLIRKT